MEFNLERLGAIQNNTLVKDKAKYISYEYRKGRNF